MFWCPPSRASQSRHAQAWQPRPQNRLSCVPLDWDKLQYASGEIKMIFQNELKTRAANRVGCASGRRADGVHGSGFRLAVKTVCSRLSDTPLS